MGSPFKGAVHGGKQEGEATGPIVSIAGKQRMLVLNSNSPFEFKRIVSFTTLS